MFTHILRLRAPRRKIIAWGLGLVALAGIATLSSSTTSMASNAECVVSKSAWNRGNQIDTISQVGSCNWTVPAGNTRIDADLVGGGGGGGISPFVGSGGGGGGQVVRLVNMNVTAGAVHIINVGDGAQQVVMADTSVGANGGTGGATSFLGYTAAGGLGGNASVSATIGGKGGDSFTQTTITTTGTVATTRNLGSLAVAGNSTCTLPRNGGGGASSFAAGLQTGGTALTSMNGANGVGTNTLYSYLYSGGGGGHRDPVAATRTAANSALGTGGAGGGGDGGLGVYAVGGIPTFAQNGVNGTGGGGGGLGGTCGKHSFGVGAATTRGGSGAVAVRYLSPSPMTTPIATSWQGFNQLDWPDYPDFATTGYKLYWSTSSTALDDANIASLPAANRVTLTGATASAYTHPNLTLGTTYFYRVSATYTNAASVATDSPLSVRVSATPRLTDTVRFISNDVNNTPRTVFAPQDFTVPANVNVIKVNAFGASANTTNASWNTGGSVLANLSVNGGDQFKLFIGSRPLTLNGVNIAGWNGGGTSGHGIEGFGGGGTDLRLGSFGLADRVVVAGGGAGRSGGWWGAAGGGLVGGTESGGQVSGGTQTGPGAAPAGTSQVFGTFGVGASATNASGAGGGGWWGGNSNSATYGGGGGSSYTVPSAYNVVHTQGGNVGDGFITITYTAQSQVPTGVIAIPGQAQNTIAWDRTDISSADGYRVYGGTTPNPTTLIATVAGVNRTAFVHTGLINGTTYYYRVAAAVPAATNNTAAILTGYSLEVAATPNFMATEKFNVTRAKQTWTVPQGVTWIQVVARGASANTTNASWNTGGTVSARIPVTPGEVLNVYVGSRPQTINGVNTIGYNGGGTSGAGIIGFGGGASDIRKGGDALSNRVIVAGGGGGRSGGWWGAAGGGLVGGTESGGQVAGGTQSGPGPQPAGVPQILGTFGVGASTTSASGAGGGGYWGGNSNTATYGGGGGSSYAHPTSVNVTHTQGGVVGDGSIEISYPTVAYPVGVQAIAGQGLNTIIWDESKIQGATGYRVYGGTTPNPTTLLTATAVAFGTNTFTHTGLTLGTTYYYRVSVMSGTLESQRSAEVSAIPSFTVDKTYNLTRGLQTFTVPSGVFWIRSTVKGASANTTNGSWNTGGTVSAILPVTPGEVLNLYVGGQPDVINGVNTLGYNGGGSSGYGILGFGGGASDIRRGGTALTDRIMVAGGGAGRSGGYWSGAGGGLIGGTESGDQVSGGTQTGPGVQPASVPQIFGTLGVGASTTSASGAGGGGYWGGNSNTATYGGGGGSSYTDPSAVNVVHTQGGVVGNGSITISFSLNQAPQNFVAIPASNRVSLSWTKSEITRLQDYQIFRRTATGAETLLATVVAPTLVHVDNTAVNGVTYFYRLVARAVVNNVAVATASTSDVIAAPTPALTVSFNATRAPQNWVVPSGVSWIQVVARGASANTTNGSWNTGGQVTASLPVTPGETLALYVGGQPKTVNGATVWGWNGGGTSGYGVTGGGGGATDIRRGGDLLGNRVLVAGGGAGRSGGYWSGAGGGLIGGTESGGQVAGGTQTGPGFQPAGVTQIFGTLGVGASTTSASGAGGGGYWGGNSNTATYGGGGGSSYAAPNAVNVVHTQGGVVGDGSITITYVIDTVAPTVTGITSPAVNTKTYKAGEDIFIDVNFSESVLVTGSPTLDINTGAGGRRTISYVSGSGTASLRFLYTVLSGDDIANVDAWSTSALSTANGANIADAAGNDASLTLPALGSPTSLSSRLLVVDGIVPAPPVLVGASGSTQITIDWSDVAAPDLWKYNIYVSTDGVNYSQLNSVLSSATLPVSIFTQQVVARGITYFYYVTAVDLRGNESDPSVITSWSIAADGTIQTPSVQVKSPTNNLLQPITGTAVPGSTVTIMDGGVVVGTVTAHATTGLYSYTPSLLDQWTVGTHSITAKASLNGVESSPTVISTMLIDTVAPTFVSQLRSSPLSEKTSSVVLVWRLTFSEPMIGLDASDFVVSGTTAVVASVTQTIGSRTSYDVRVTGGNIGSVEGNIELAFAPAMIATDVAGNALADTTPSGLRQNFILDHTYPTMTLSSNKVALGAGGTALITFTSSIEPVAGEFVASDVSVTGGTLSGFSGSGTVYTATFTPTVGFSGAAAIDVIAGSYNSVSGLPNMRATQLVITVDTVAPTVSSVTAVPSAGSYKAGDVVVLHVVFSESVTVTGVPTLKLETGATDQTAIYVSGSGTNTLVFNYTVVAGNVSADLNYFDVNSLVRPSGSTITDGALNVAVLTLPAVTAGTTGNLASSAAIVIDTIAPNAPTALALSPVGGTVVASTLNSTNTNLTATATIGAGLATGGRAELLLGSDVIATDSTILAADTTVSFNLGSTSTASLQSSLAAGGSVSVRLFDAAGNMSNSSAATNLTVDYVKPSVSSFAGMAATLSGVQTVTISTSESVSGFAVADIVSSCGGTSALTGSAATYTYTFTPPAAFTGSCTFTIAAGNFSDAAGNTSNVFTASSVVDTAAPTVTSVTAVSPNATYIVGQSVDISVNFSEPVIVAGGTPTLAIRSTPSSTATAVYVSGTATNKLIFRYSISAGDNSNDLNYASTTALALPTGVTIRDAASNNASLVLPAITAGTVGNLATNASIVVDALAPSAPAAPVVTVVGGTVVATFVNSTNTNITASVAGLIAGDVTGGKAELLFTPNGGTATVVAADIAISATDTTATFDLGVTSNSALQTLILSSANGTGTFSVRLTDVSGNVSALGTPSASFTIDYVRPTLAISSAATSTLSATQTSAITFTASEPTTNFVSGDATANLGTLGSISALVGGTPNRYTASFTPNASGSWSVLVAASVFTDAAGNPNVAATAATGLADITPASITRVFATDGLYKAGDAIDITVEFSEAVNVASTRTITLSNSRTAVYQAGNSTANVVFRYVVQAGDQVIDLNYASAAGWSGTGNVTDLVGNVSNVSLPLASGSGSLVSTSNVNIDALAPVAPNAPTFVITGSSVSNTLNSTSTNIAITSTWAAADSSLSQAEFLLNGSVIGRVAIAAPATSTSATLNMNTATSAELQEAIPVGGVVTVRLIDIAGNTATSTGTNLNADFVALSLLISLQIGTIISGQTRTVNFNLSESAASSSFTLSDLTATNGTLSNFSGSASSYSATFTPAANFTGTATISIAPGSVTDVAGNPTSVGSSISVPIDTAAPLLVIVAGAATSSINNITFVVTANEPIDCTTLAASAGVDFNISNGALVSIQQTTDFVCTLLVTANATRGSPKNVSVTLASTFAASDNNGNTQTTMTGAPVSTLVTLPGTAPSAPTALAASPAAEKALLTWAAPADLGGEPSVTYAVQIATATNPADSDFTTVASGDISYSGSSATVSNLTNGISYKFRVRATNTVGSSNWSAVSASTVPFDVPSAPSAVVTATANGLNLSITAGAENGRPITSMQYSLNAGATWTNFASLATSQNVTSLVNGTSYVLRLRSVNEAGPSAAFVANAVTPVGPASAPNITSATGADGSVVVSFTSPADNGGAPITNYKFSTDGGYTFLPLTTATTTSPITLTGLTNGTQYSIRLLAISNGTDGAFSNAVPVTPMTVPSAPSGLSVTSGNSSVSISFTAGNNNGSAITGYEFAVSAAGSSSYANWVSVSSTSSPVTISGLTNGMTYDIKLRATNAVGSGQVATVLSAVPGTRPSAPQIGVVSGSSGSITMPFTVFDNGGAITAHEYEIRENPTACVGIYDAAAPGGTNWSAWTGFVATNSSLVLNGLTNGTCYEVSIRAINAFGVGNASRSSGKPVTDPDAPTIESVTRADQSLAVVFSSPNDNGGLTIVDYEYRVNGASWLSAGLVSPFTISGLTNGTSYSIELRTKTQESASLFRFSAASSAMSAVPAAVPAQLTITSAIAGDGFIDLTIQDPTLLVNNGGSTIFAIRYSIDGGANWINATWTQGSTAVRVAGLTNSLSTGYSIQLIAVNSVGSSIASASTATISAGTVPETPAIVAVATDSKISLSYAPPADGGFAITGYRYSIDGGTSWLAVTANPLLIHGLTNGTTYSVMVQAENAKGNSASASASATPAGAASAPTILVTANGSTVSTVSFTAPVNTGGVAVSLSGYEISTNGGLTWQAATIASGSLSSGTIELSGLTNGVTYSVKLRALNSFGPGAASATAAAMPVANVPAAPTVNLTAGRNQIAVSLSQGSDGGAPISSYEYSTDGNNWIVSSWVVGSQPSFNILGLLNGTSYNVQVRAVNSAGASAPSATAAATPTGEAAALLSISSYTATAGETRPSLADYSDAGVTGVTASNISALNSILAGLPTASRDSSTEIQAIVNALNKLLALANAVDDVASVASSQNLSTSEWALIGISFSSDQALLANDFADELFASSLDSASDLSAFATAIKNIIPISNVLTLADATTLALLNVTAGNISDLKALIANQTSVSAVDTKAEIVALSAAAALAATQRNALAIITAYDSTNVAPTVSQFVAAGIASVDSSNISAILELLGPASPAATDSAAEVQAYVDAVNLLRSSASASLSISAALTLTDFAALGLPTIDTNSEMSLFNQIATGIGFSAVDTIAERSLLLALVDKVMALAAVTPPAALPQPTLTAADLTALGVTGVDSSNIAVVLSALAATANDGSGVDTTAKIQAVAQAAIAAQSATTLIAGYTAASGQIAPTASDFVAAGVTGVTSSNISLVNEFLASLPAGSRDTASEIQALVDAVNHIILQANGVGDNGSHITAADLAALGFAAPAGTTASVVSLVNSAADEMNALVSPSLIDTAAEFANLMRITSSIAATASGLGANPALTAEDFQVLGVVGVDATNLAAMINQIIATSDDASGVNSLAKLNALLAAANAVAARDSAIAELMAYTGTQTAPTSSTYSDANVSGVNGLNIATINSLIADLPESAKDSTGEIQSIVDAYAKVATLANSSAGGTATSSLTASEFATLGLSTIDNSTEVALMNTWLDTSASTAVDSSSELNAVANAIAKLAATAAVTPPATLPSPALTLADLYVLGISGATSENLATIIAFIANSANDASGVSSVTALQNLVDAAASQAFSDAAALQISLYDGVGAAPTRNQYTDAGVTGVDLANRDTVNSIVAALTPARSDTTAELQAVVDSVDKIRALADGTAANGGASALSAQNFAAIGLFAIDTAAEVALFNSILDAQQVSDVDSMSELAEIARIVQAIVAAAAGLTSNPALAPEDFALIGIAGVDNANLSATLALIGATNDNATGVDSLAELAAIQVAGQQAAAIAQASELIASYSGTNQAPVLATYVTVGVNGVNATNLTAVNAFLAPISSAQSDSQAEVQAIVDAVNKLAALADSSTATGAALSSADLLALGVAEFSAPGVAEKMSLLNSLLDVKSLQDVGSPADLAALIEIINRLINKTLGQIVVPEISESDFAALGISGVTTAPDGGNLSVVLAVLSSTQPSAVDTATELANVIASIVADLTSNPSLKVIVDYAENNSNTKPVVLDYTSIPGSGTALVDDSTIVAINALIDSKTASEVSTSAKVSQLIYEFFVALGRIVEFARDSTMNEAPTLADYQIAGLRTIDANSVAAMNAVIAGLQASEVDTPAKLQAILDRLRSASGNTTSPITAGPINRITLTEGTLGPVIKWDGSNSVSVEVISSSGVIKTLLINGQNETSLDLSKLESGRAYAILVSPVGSTNPADSQRVAYAVAPATPSKTEVSPISSNRLQLTWTQTGYAKQYQIIATPSKGRVVTMLTSNTSAQLNLIAGRKYEVTITAIGEGDKRSSAVIADVNLPGAISTVIATPVAGKKQTLVSWTPLVVQPNARYQVRVNGKVVCTSTLTSCAVPQTLSSKQDVTVSLVGGPATAVEIVDSKLVYTNDVGFIPNTTTLAPGARAEILASAKALVAAKFTTVVVTGHANPVDGIPLKISTKLANDRALVIVKMLRKLMPGVKIVAVGRSVFSPSNPGLNQSLGNIRAEIYGTR